MSNTALQIKLATARAMNILVVDDDPDVLDSIATIIQSLGYNVIKAKNGKEALVAANTNPKIDLIISDINMPEMDGVTFYNEIRSQKIPFIAMTGYSKLLDMEQAYQIGINEFIPKPFTREELINSLELIIHDIDLGTDGSNRKLDLDNEYCKVHVSDFLSGSRSAMDIYLRLSPSKYICIARSDVSINADRFQSFQKKGINFLYIKKEDFSKYVGFNLKVAQAVISGKKPISKSLKLKLLRHSSEVYLANIFMKGVDSESFQASKVLVETTLQLMTESDDIYKMLEMLRSQSDPLYGHSLGVSLYSAMVAKKIGWTSASTQFKIAMAGLLHDIGKKELPKELLDKRRIDFSAAEVKLYESHTLRGSEILSQVPAIPAEIIIAATQHHESLSGLGFPYKLTRAKIHGISRLVAVVDEFCKLALSGPMGDSQEPLQAIQRLVEFKILELDPLFFRGLMEVFSFPVPKELLSAKSFKGTDNF